MSVCSTPAAVVFDMDGLLLDSERVALGLLATCAAELGLPWNEAAGLGMVGRNERDSDVWLLAHFGPDFPVARLRGLFNRRYQQRIRAAPMPLKNGAAELLTWLDAAGLPCAVATSTRQSLALEKLRGAGIARHFRAIVGSDQVARGKPAPDIYLAALAALRVAPAEALALEDSDAGVAAAQAAGCAVLMVPDVRPASTATLATGVKLFASLHDVRQSLAASAATAADALSSDKFVCSTSACPPACR